MCHQVQCEVVRLNVRFYTAKMSQKGKCVNLKQKGELLESRVIKVSVCLLAKRYGTAKSIVCAIKKGTDTKNIVTRI